MDIKRMAKLKFDTMEFLCLYIFSAGLLKKLSNIHRFYFDFIPGCNLDFYVKGYLCGNM